MYIKQSSSNSITFGLRALQLDEIYIINNKMEYFKNSNILLDYVLSIHSKECSQDVSPILVKLRVKIDIM